MNNKDVEFITTSLIETFLPNIKTKFKNIFNLNEKNF